MRIADIFEIKLPAVVGLVSQVLGFAGNRKNLSSRSPYFLNDTFVNVTPQLGATWRSPKSAVEKQNREGMLR